MKEEPAEILNAAEAIESSPDTRLHLVLHNRADKKFNTIRPLSTQEVEHHAKYTKLIADVRNQLSLFRILDRNFNEWSEFLDSLLSSSYKETFPMDHELNRLLLNYLAFAYSIEQHFKRAVARRARKDPKRKDHYDDFFKRLCQHCWPIAFIFDFRDYVQHAGLAVSHCTRNRNFTSINIVVTADASDLLRGSRGCDWKRSQLSADKGQIDLVQTLREFHVQMLQSYAAYVVSVFKPELEPAKSFYEDLTMEVRSHDPAARMYLSKGPFRSTDLGNGKKTFDISLVEVPNALFEELGIKVNKLDSGQQRVRLEIRGPS